MTITVCICGAGTMGGGIAQVAAQSGFKTVLFDSNPEALEKAENTILKNLQFLVEKKNLQEKEREAIIGRMSFTVNIRDCFGQLIIEAIVEELEAKRTLLKELASFNNEDSILASNTSSISISKIQADIPFPERVVGMHFFNPPYIMKLVEVVKGDINNDEIINAVIDLCDKMNKTAVVCKDSPGFIVNRVARQYYLESLHLAEKGVATFEQIDEILEAIGFKMGPFKLMDLIGMDINLATTESLYDAFNRPDRLKPSTLQIQKVKNGNLGKKSGRGFYSHQ